jgi:hypothetical protein
MHTLSTPVPQSDLVQCCGSLKQRTHQFVFEITKISHSLVSPITTDFVVMYTRWTRQRMVRQWAGDEKALCAIFGSNENAAPISTCQTPPPSDKYLSFESFPLGWVQLLSEALSSHVPQGNTYVKNKSRIIQDRNKSSYIQAQRCKVSATTTNLVCRHNQILLVQDVEHGLSTSSNGHSIRALC